MASRINRFLTFTFLLVDSGSCIGHQYGTLSRPDSANGIVMATGGKQHDMQHVAVAANETVGTTTDEAPQTIMIIQEEDLEDLNGSVRSSEVCLEAHITAIGPGAAHMTSVEMSAAVSKVNVKVNKLLKKSEVTLEVGEWDGPGLTQNFF